MNKFKLTPKLIKIIFGAVCILVAVVVTLSVMLTSYTDWKKYYDSVMAEKAMQKLPLELLGIEARLADGVIYYDNDTAEPEATDFEVTANFTEKGRNFSRGLGADDFSFEVPEDFSLHGGKIVITYEWQPEKTTEDEPEPVVKTAELDITLVQPDATVYKMTKIPTYTETGSAENIEGDVKVLPVLDDVSYNYEEFPKTGIAKFVYEELGLTIKKPLLDEMSIETADGTKADVNNVNCYFTAKLGKASLLYDDINKSFVLTVNQGETLNIANVDADNFTIGGGEVEMHSMLKLQSLTVKSGASLKISGVEDAIEVTDLSFEDGSEVTLETTRDGILLYGDAEFYGTFNMTRTSGYGGTAVYIQKDLDIKFSETSRVTITNYSFTLATFGDDEKDISAYLPYGAEKQTSGDGHTTVTGWYLQDDGRTKIVEFVNSEYPFYGVAEKTQNRGGYEVTKTPTLTEQGLATAEGQEDIVLPVLSLNDYEIEEKANGETAFTLKGQGITFYETIDGERITIDGVTYNKVTLNLTTIENLTASYADGVYTLNAAAGQTAELSSINGGAIVIGGTGTLKLTYSEGAALKATSLTVKNGATLEIPNANIAIDASRLLCEAGSTVALTASGDGIMLYGDAELYGTFSLTRSGAIGGTGVNVLASQVKIKFADTSRATFTNYDYTLATWNGSTDILMVLPYGTEKETTGSGNATRTCWYTSGDSRHDIVTCVNSPNPLFSMTDRTATADGYIVTKTPTETEAGLAVADGKEDIVLPALNNTDYTVEEQTDGRIKYTHKTSQIVVYFTVDGERITVDGKEYNRVTVNNLAADGVTFSYAEGVYTVNVAAGKTAEFVSINCNSLVIEGEGTLKLTASSDTALVAGVSLTVRSGASLEIPNASVAIDAVGILFEAGSTVTLVTANDGILLRGNAKLFGTFNLTHSEEVGSTGISTLNNNYQIEFADTSRVTFTNWFVAIGTWNSSENVTVAVPTGTQQRTDNGTQWVLNEVAIVTFTNVSTVIYNLQSPF